MPSKLTQNKWDLHNTEQAEGFPWQQNQSVKDAIGKARCFTWMGTKGSYKTAETDGVESSMLGTDSNYPSRWALE